jgi:hypothetical protein
MTRVGLLMTAALALAAHGAAAQGNAAVPPSDNLPYAMPMAVPANGCAWAGLTYSDGAIIQGRLALPTFFRCSGGIWESFNSAEQATDRSHAQDLSGSSQPRR